MGTCLQHTLLLEINTTTTLHYTVSQVEPYINWLYFYHAWGLSGKPQSEKDKLRREADDMLADMDRHYATHAVVGLYEANSDGDDILINGLRLPMLRQQMPSAPGEPNLCLADFIRPQSQGIKDTIGAFVATVDKSMEASYQHDDYLRMLSQTLADRLAEATVERMHLEVRTRLWGYAPDEHLAIDELLREEFQGIRPAVGYPSMPDTSVNFLLDRLLHFSTIGARLTMSGMMMPHASVSGLMFAHPAARYFSLGKIDEAQLADYARRRRVPIALMRGFLGGCVQ